MKSTFFHLLVPDFFLSFSYLLNSYPVPSMSLQMTRSILSVAEWYLVVHNVYHTVFARFSGQSMGKWLILHLGYLLLVNVTVVNTESGYCFNRKILLHLTIDPALGLFIIDQLKFPLLLCLL